MVNLECWHDWLANSSLPYYRYGVRHDLAGREIENTRWVSFDIKFTRQGFENACWHREACRAIQHAFSKPSLVNLISKDANLVFYLSGSQFWTLFKLAIMTYFFLFLCWFSVISDVIQKCNVIMTWGRKRLLGYVETIQFISGVTDKIVSNSLSDGWTYGWRTSST